MSIDPSVSDRRSGKIMFVSHCVLNQNAKVRGIANYPAAIRPLVDLLLDNDVSIYQMPCPEMTYSGAMRWGQTRDQYNSPMFRRHCGRLAETLFDQIEDYVRCGYQVVGFVLVDGSPACGLNKTAQPAVDGDMWGGMVWYLPKQKFAAGSGVFCQVLQAEAQHRDLDVPFVSIPEVHEAGSLEAALGEIKKLIDGAGAR
jgi:predicted secreted protein